MLFYFTVNECEKEGGLNGIFTSSIRLITCSNYHPNFYNCLTQNSQRKQMIEAAIAVSLAVLGLTIHNMRCIHRIEKKILFYMYENKKENHDLEDK
jgi:hypothetical protein